MHADRVVHGLRPLATQLAGHRERRDASPVAHLVGEHPTQAGDVVLIAQEPVHAHVVRGERSGKLVDAHRQRVGSEPVERGSGQRVAGEAPHARPAFLARLGEQQCRPVGEHEPGLAVARLHRLLVVHQ